MRFWGAEVQAEKPLIVNPGEDYSIHISQATLDLKGKHFKGKGKDLKGKEKDLKGKDLKEKEGGTADLFVEVDGQKLMIGSLSQDKFPHVCFDLVFEKEFELSHSLTEGSVHFVGYRSPNIDEKERDDFSGSQAVPAANGNAASNVVKVDSKQKAKPADEEDSDADEEDSDGEDDGSDSEKRMDVDEDDEDDSEEDKETPKQPEPSNKKRANESASNTRVSSKKAKLAVTPQKTEEKKKGGHTATPHPAKKGGKSPGIANQSPKFGGQSSGGSNKK